VDEKGGKKDDDTPAIEIWLWEWYYGLQKVKVTRNDIAKKSRREEKKGKRDEIICVEDLRFRSGREHDGWPVDR
jgi:hypothetical protein